MTMEALTSSAGDNQAPTVPGGLTAIAGSSSQISLSWTASSDAVGVTAYKVYRGGVLLTTLGNVTTYSDTGLTASTTYSYTIAACDAASNCSAQSSSASATTQQGTSTSANSKSDCLFNWAENEYGALFSPRTQSLTFGPYYLRYYSQTSSYLAVTSNSLVYLGPLSGNQLLDLGSATTWYA
ncbi:MAG: fibronectin type III domain-containing protein, partial [Rhodocyclaceae bacterium]